MFLLLAPSLHTGKRPGFYCPGGQRSQDAPKGLKEEERGWIGKHDKEACAGMRVRAHALSFLKKLNSKSALYSQHLSHCGSFKS